ncbi:CxxxxCH/CxxCH domain-containing protein [Anaeromyxobacter sp. Fw109-5]|uniref:CxxxxCH/CxxCH domain c-type cytochrome n=1 Tax=Anaeromyxobacter sp. (strain Fw109-5) TaxID=404589 RepID=UPI0000ED8B52|nr:CxxxxCH/CxxCH domain-containing protein [Anaeromyxobacter sp. Fw109-5]ABS27246.1 cytochrome C family protein [Anaeromyxobacter sp. Fw109-5]
MQVGLWSCARRRLPALLLCAAALAAGPLGCGNERTIQGEADAATCSRCHGSAENSAPPLSVKGARDGRDPAVGAHQVHVRGSALRAPLACSDCHVVPQGAGVASHIDGEARISFGALARAGGASPEWFRATASCSATYCHGATLHGGALTAPVWTGGASQAACGACHGLPPPPPHVQNPDCGRCHVGYSAGAVVAATHVDGKVDVKPLGCNGCHGSATSAAPPIGTAGDTANTTVAVGAHQEHLRDGAIRARLRCEDCHALPTETLHADGTVDLDWGALATADGATPSFDAGSATCSSTYCHGATLAGGGGLLTAPVWTTVDGTQASCGACHLAPPGLPHPQRADCRPCHPGTLKPDGTGIDVAGGQHVDGTLDLAPLTCSMCHGSETNAAPPLSTLGESDTSAIAVGAHQKHVRTGPIRSAIECVECHVTPAPTEYLHANGEVDVDWGPLAARGTTPAWARASATCASTYCHGATLALGGGTATTPVWTSVSEGPTACDACHGAPPPLPHPQSADCSRCHSGTVLADGGIHVAGGLHIDGTVQAEGKGTCTACHGTPGVNPAPPFGTRGETLTSQRAVGAHQKHVVTGSIRAAFACSDCHARVTDLGAHANGAISLPFTGLASSGTTPLWNGTTCASTYCHGATLAAGGANQAPTWTVVSSGPAGCGSCHGAPPPLPHPQSTDCSRCHSGTVLASGAIDLARGQHIDGTVQVDGGGCTACHGTEGVNPAPPLGTNGETLTTQRAVGAHQKHVVDGNIRKAFACSDCHAPVTDLTHVNGTITMPFDGLASLGTAPVWNGATCASTYCHGATLAAGGANQAPTWTVVSSGPTGCGSCHGAPPPLPHPQSTDCSRCHSGTVLASGAIDLARGQHIDGTVQVDGGGCTACHGTEGVNPAPPLGTNGETLTTQRAVGAHQKHVVDGNIRKAFACSDCHAPVTDLTHVNGAISLPFTGLASSGTTPLWNGATCASTYCHGATLAAGGANEAPTWTVVSSGPTGCGSCHGAPPPLPHPQTTDCSRCHSGTVLASGAIDLARGQHIDGTVQVDGGGCTACHGTEGVNPAPPLGTNGETLTTQRAVGAHQKHLVTGTIRAAFACSDCHAPVTDLTHVNGAISLPFTGLASSGTTPLWNGATCASTYCHGATLAAGGANEAPTWTVVSSGPTGCGSCHGAPPPLPHPQTTDCSRCHSGTVLASGAIDLARGQHIDGTVQVDGGGCTACHGTEGVNPAPPLGTNGETLTTQRAVGAHQKHLVTGTIRAAFACSDCHAPVTDLTHVNGTISLPFTGLASSGTTPVWNGATCASTYCHGATLAAGGANEAPTWTVVSTGPTGCGSCHGSPPPLPHPQNTDCNRCHPGTVLATGVIDLARGQHIDGTVQVDGGGCTACHGTDGLNPAPPLGTNGETLTTQLAVGAHQKHVVDGNIRKAFTCSDCHAPVTDLTHVNGTISLPFEGLAATSPATPTWTRATATCSSTYCHGATLGAGGSTHAPVWTQVSAGDTSCTSCHGFPPPTPHPQNPLCNSCHPLTVRIDGKIDVAGGRHVDGIVDVAGLTCRSCHGSSANPAPPVGTRGESETTELAVGAHQKHVQDGPIRAAVPCEECHVVPTELLHGNETVDLAWGPLATALGAAPSWDPSQATCASTYCHGAQLAAGGALTTPTWTDVSPGQTSCGSCHGAPPPPPHPVAASCAGCHPDTVKPDGTIDVAGGRHIDGKLDASGTCGACHGVPPTNGAHLAHAAFPTPDVPQYGDLRILEAYAPEGGPAYRFGCGHCHPLDAAKHMDFELEVELSPAGAGTGSLRARNAPDAAYDESTGRCSGVYCHSSGQAIPAYALAPAWTSGADLACDGCHGNPPRYPSGGEGAVNANGHLGLTDRGREFGHYAGLGGPAHASKHGSAQPGVGAAAITCQACHYATTDPTAVGPSGVYWLDTTGSYQLPGGDPARLSDPLWKATQCGTCHAAGAAPVGAGRVLPLTHVNGRRDVAFDPRTTLPPSSGLPPAPDTPTRPYWVAPAKFCEAVPAGAVIDGTTLSIELSGAAYDPATKRCSGVACHLGDAPVWGRPYLNPGNTTGTESCCRCHSSRCAP